MAKIHTLSDATSSDATYDVRIGDFWLSS